MSKVPPFVSVTAFCTVSAFEPRLNDELPLILRLRPSVSGPPLNVAVPLGMLVVPAPSIVPPDQVKAFVTERLVPVSWPPVSVSVGMPMPALSETMAGLLIVTVPVPPLKTEPMLKLCVPLLSVQPVPAWTS